MCLSDITKAHFFYINFLLLIKAAWCKKWVFNDKIIDFDNILLTRV